MKNPIKKGNAKLAKTVGIFNLPEGQTCPGATAFCRAHCYANKRYTGKSKNDNVTVSRRRNLDLTHSPTFIQDMVKWIADSELSLFRIHESGDFYDQEYLDKWLTICAFLPQVQFLVYTKSFHLDLSLLESRPNVQLYRSYDPSSPGVVPLSKRVTYVVPKGQDPDNVVPGYFVCPAAKFHSKKIKNYCGTLCKRCWLGTAKIAFLEH